MATPPQEQEKKRSYEITILQRDKAQRVTPHNTVVTNTTLQQAPFRKPSAYPDSWAAPRPELALEIEVAPYPYENKKTVFSGTPLPVFKRAKKRVFPIPSISSTSYRFRFPWQYPWNRILTCSAVKRLCTCVMVMSSRFGLLSTMSSSLFKF
jgi:hypothetical protein